MSERKSFFKEREVNEILEDFRVKQAFNQKNLVERILDLEPSHDAIEIRTRITPGRFFINTENSAEASRKCYKHGDLIALSQPKTKAEAYECQDIPLAIRAKDFEKLKDLKEEEINFVGYCWHPVQGRDRRKRVVPFVWCPEGERIFAYSEHLGRGIEIEAYADSQRVKIEGANVVCTVPSRRKKEPRYKVRLINVPVEGVTERRAIVWGLKTQYGDGEETEHSIYNIRYTWKSDREASDKFTFYPQDIAAYIKFAGESWKKHNLVPMEMNPFALPSRKEAEFYKKLCNNVIIYDPTIKSKKNLRKPHLDEKSILIARSIKVLGHDGSMLWDPQRDGKLKDYDWGIPQ